MKPWLKIGPWGPFSFGTVRKWGIELFSPQPALKLKLELSLFCTKRKIASSAISSSIFEIFWSKINKISRGIRKRHLRIDSNNTSLFDWSSIFLSLVDNWRTDERTSKRPLKLRRLKWADYPLFYHLDFTLATTFPTLSHSTFRAVIPCVTTALSARSSFFNHLDFRPCYYFPDIAAFQFSCRDSLRHNPLF